jgi:hypothetical protein
MLNYFKINCICSSFGEQDFWTFLRDRGE